MSVKNVALIIALLLVGVVSVGFRSASDEVKDGLYRTYYKNGNLHTSYYYKKGREEGAYKVYYENGYIKEEGYEL